MKKHLLLPMALLLLAFSSCVKEEPVANIDSTGQRTKSADVLTAKDHIKIAVLSDIHYMHPDLLLNNAQEGTAFKADLKNYPNKAVQEYSAPIFEQVISELKKEHPDIILVAGDMAKSGEYISHEAVANSFKELQENSKLYVIPGNNDINNTSAKGFNGNDSYRVPNINVSTFLSFYGNFGYNSTTTRDKNSLSYLARPYPGLWILAIDAAQYDPKNERPGIIKPQTMAWIKERMQAARDSNVLVLGLMHFNLVEHFANQVSVYANTVVNQSSWQTTADSLISWGLQLIFTGHNHANDITARSFDGRTLYDIQTGSLVTPPSHYRIVTLKNKELDISTHFVTSINVPLPDGMKFTDYSNQRLSAAFDTFLESRLTTMFGLPSNLVPDALPLVRNALMAHIAGDEKISPLEQDKINILSSQDPQGTSGTVSVITNSWSDLNTRDTKTHIKLTNL